MLQRTVPHSEALDREDPAPGLGTESPAAEPVDETNENDTSLMVMAREEEALRLQAFDSNMRAVIEQDFTGFASLAERATAQFKIRGTRLGEVGEDLPDELTAPFLVQ